MELHDIPLHTLEGEPTSLAPWAGRLLLVVNVASSCGLTTQYEGLEQLHETYAARGFSVLGFPCNQFLEQEPGDAEQIREFCSSAYGITFPLLEKIEVNGPGRHPLYATLCRHPDADGVAGDVAWNFEKFLVSPHGEVLARFRPLVEPLDAYVVERVEAYLPIPVEDLR